MLCALPVEIAARELLGMLYLSLHLAKKGFPSLVGERMVYRYVRESTHPICYFDSDQHKETNEHVLANGGIIINTNSEGLSLLDNPESAVKNFGKVADYVTKIGVWGERQKEVLMQHLPEKQHDQLVVTGYPSFDLLKNKFLPMYKDQSIISEYGENFIMFNTSFGFYNHEMGCENYVRMLTKMKEWQLYATEEYQEFIRETCDYQKDIISEVIAMIQHISKEFPDRTIIVRPHPAENKELYKSHFKDCPNVTVTNDKEVRPWLASAAVVIHHDCTTGMEAMLLGKPVIQYRPIFNEKVTSDLMAHIGHKTFKPEDVADAIRNLDELPTELTEEMRAYLKPLIANIQMSAAAKQAEIAQEYDNGEPSWFPEPLGFIGQAKCWRKHISKLIRQHQPGRNGRKVTYALKKFPRIRREEIVKKLEKLRQIEPELPEVTVEQLCLNTWLIKPKQ